MAIDGEPEDGDFVRYVEHLNRQAGSPGQVLAAQSGRKKRGRRAREAAPEMLGHTSPSTAFPGDAANTTVPPTLAARTAQRRIALGLTIAGAFAAWHAVRQLIYALEFDPMEFDDLLPAIFLGVCAFMLFKGASRLRATQRRNALPTLPPLSTLPANPKHRA